MNCKDMVKQYLIDNNYDGLFYPGECACGLDDMFPCGEYMMDCEPGYKIPCPNKGDCYCEEYGEDGWHISAEKPTEKEK